MADETVTDDALITRNHLCLEAVWELDKLARIMPGLVPIDDNQTHYAIRGICGRFLRLTSMLMDGLGDRAVSNEDMERILHFSEFGQA